ncbi:MerR family transcriptional regulator [Bacillus subtilis]|uniref:MerR family transcriptional regulator n=1 Tax=Bacillus subtilis TaxID=1423 RepID=UPI003CF2C7CF
MPIEVSHITLGDASSRLEVPAPTLRHWTDQLEEFNVHFVLRNQRNERIYEEDDIKIFALMRDLKSEYGRRTTTKDIGYMIREKGESGELNLRTREDAPPPNPSNRQADLLNQEDIKQILDSERARQVVGYMMAEASKNIANELTESLKEQISSEMSEVNKRLSETNDILKKELEERDRRLEERDRLWEERAIKRDEALMKSMRETMENKNKGLFAKLFGK